MDTRQAFEHVHNNYEIVYQFQYYNIVLIKNNCDCCCLKCGVEKNVNIPTFLENYNPILIFILSRLQINHISVTKITTLRSIKKSPHA